MKPTLEILPARTGGAAENMALDFLLLQRYPRATAPRFRHYSWRAPAFTFGYSQKIAFVRSVLPAGETFELCRRPTGGGVVDHRDDWTFALVIPRGHPLEEVRAIESYRAIHESLAEALRRQGVPAATKNTEVERVVPNALVRDATASEPIEAATNASTTAGPGVCFERAELFDVIHEASGRKIAGAAQKRNKHGLLFQGSLWRPALGQPLDDEQLLQDFTELLARALALPAESVPWPELNEDEVSGLTEQYSSPEWIEWR
ncbi:lipoate--protein ligase family protein [Opitutus terrae]|uniref:lipoate--protein ligase family protein n=1 Tax=Opitutus terrae TaxID=107709 RepID=UPI001ED95E70|nr:lipoate--protein ligase family protein [Opitutus terrae]